MAQGARGIGDEWIGWGGVVKVARGIVLFVLFVVDRSSTLVRELFLALGGRTYNIEHVVPF